MRFDYRCKIDEKVGGDLEMSMYAATRPSLASNQGRVVKTRDINKNLNRAGGQRVRLRLFIGLPRY
jgi:hypothetical protein